MSQKHMKTFGSLKFCGSSHQETLSAIFANRFHVLLPKDRPVAGHGQAFEWLGLLCRISSYAWITPKLPHLFPYLGIIKEPLCPTYKSNLPTSAYHQPQGILILRNSSVPAPVPERVWFSRSSLHLLIEQQDSHRDSIMLWLQSVPPHRSLPTQLHRPCFAE